MESLVGRVGFALEENGSSTDNLKVIYIHFFFLQLLLRKSIDYAIKTTMKVSHLQCW